MKELSKRFPVWFCDIWGVVHDGQKPFKATVSALTNHRSNGGVVILVSNSPRTSSGVESQLAEYGVSHLSYDAVVTSGDVTRDLITQYGGVRVFHLGTKRDFSIYEGLNVKLVELAEAESVVCTGLFDEDSEIPSDYVSLLRSMKEQKLPMICANPDKVVRKGGKLVYCAGALAEQYQFMEAIVLMAGKPFQPIYDLSLRKAKNLLGHAIDQSQILAIGDGPETDIQGAANQGLACVLITGGINSGADVLKRTKVAVPNANIISALPELDWT